MTVDDMNDLVGGNVMSIAGSLPEGVERVAGNAYPAAAETIEDCEQGTQKELTFGDWFAVESITPHPQFLIVTLRTFGIKKGMPCTKRYTFTAHNREHFLSVFRHMPKKTVPVGRGNAPTLKPGCCA